MVYHKNPLNHSHNVYSITLQSLLSSGISVCQLKVPLLCCRDVVSWAAMDINISCSLSLYINGFCYISGGINGSFTSIRNLVWHVCWEYCRSFKKIISYLQWQNIKALLMYCTFMQFFYSICVSENSLYRYMCFWYQTESHQQI